MSQKYKEIREFRGILNVTQASKIKVNNSYIPEGTTNTSIAQKENYKAYVVPTVRHIKGEKEKPVKIQQIPINHIVHRCIFNSKVSSIIPLFMS